MPRLSMGCIFLLVVLNFMLASCATKSTGFETSTIDYNHDPVNNHVDQVYEELVDRNANPAVIVENKKLPAGIKEEVFTYKVQKGYAHKLVGTIDTGDFKQDNDYLLAVKRMAAAAGGDFVFFPKVGNEKNQQPYGERAWVFKLDPRVKKTFKSTLSK